MQGGGCFQQSCTHAFINFTYSNYSFGLVVFAALSSPQLRTHKRDYLPFELRFGWSLWCVLTGEEGSLFSSPQLVSAAVVERRH